MHEAMERPAGGLEGQGCSQLAISAPERPGQIVLVWRF